MDSSKAAIEEPKASPPDARLKAISQAHERGIKTAVSNEPIWSVEDSVGIIEAVKCIADEIKVGPLNHDPRAKTIDYFAICPKIKDAIIKSGIKYLLKRDFLDFLFSPEYLDSVLTCRRIRKAIASGITDPIKLSEAAGIPVCIAAKWPGVNSIAAEAVLGQFAEHGRGLHFSKKTETIVCAVCGADLTGKGRIEKNGIFYCAQPGCGYPNRGEEAMP